MPISRVTLAGIFLLTIPLFLVPAKGGQAEDRAPRVRLLFDDYYQKPRDESHYSQGVALTDGARPETNYYSPIANASSNGLFALAELISDKYDVSLSSRPISTELLNGTEAYMLVCPILESAGGQGPLGETESALLHDYVENGGILILVLNSMPKDVSQSEFDLEGMNRIAGKFGWQFLTEETGTISVPVRNNHPLFDRIDAVIYGNGTAIRIAPDRQVESTIVLQDPRDIGRKQVLGVVQKYGKGRVLAFGDAGTFGNAHIFRNDLKHGAALRQLFLALLPDGPVPRYLFQEGMQAQVNIRQEQMLGGYEHENRLLALEKAPGVERIESAPRAVDLANSKDGVSDPNNSRYTVFRRLESLDLTLQFGAHAGAAMELTGESANGRFAAQILPNGRVINSSVATGELAHWQWLINNLLVCSPLRTHAQPGDVWEAHGFEALPQYQLFPVPVMAMTTSKYTFEGETTRDLRRCYLIKRSTWMQVEDWGFQDVVRVEAIAQFGPEQVKIMTGGQLVVTKYWIDAESLLPLHTEIIVSNSIWWKDHAYPERYEGSHDWRNFETWKEINFVADYGRKITVDFNFQ